MSAAGFRPPGRPLRHSASGCFKRRTCRRRPQWFQLQLSGSFGYYWSSSAGLDYSNGYYAYFLHFLSGSVYPQSDYSRCGGLSVRLVQCQSQDPLLAELFLSYWSARSNKRNTQSQVRFERNLVANLLALYHDIASGRYRVGRSMCFIGNPPMNHV